MANKFIITLYSPIAHGRFKTAHNLGNFKYYTETDDSLFFFTLMKKHMKIYIKFHTTA